MDIGTNQSRTSFLVQYLNLRTAAQAYLSWYSGYIHTHVQVPGSNPDQCQTLVVTMFCNISTDTYFKPSFVDIG